MMGVYVSTRLLILDQPPGVDVGRTGGEDVARVDERPQDGRPLRRGVAPYTDCPAIRPKTPWCSTTKPAASRNGSQSRYKVITASMTKKWKWLSVSPWVRCTRIADDDSNPTDAMQARTLGVSDDSEAPIVGTKRMAATRSASLNGKSRPKRPMSDRQREPRAGRAWPCAAASRRRLAAAGLLGAPPAPTTHVAQKLIPHDRRGRHERRHT